MRHPAIRTGAATACALVFCALTACLPPGPAGFIVPGPQKPGRVVVSMQGGGGGHTAGPEAAGGSVHVEPFVTARWSLPLTLEGMRLTDSKIFEDGGMAEQIDWAAAVRLGFRYRVGSHYSVGAGVTGGAAQVRSWDDEGYAYGPHTEGLIRVDFEWSWGRRWGSLGLCISQRLVWESTRTVGFHVPTEATLAWFPNSGPVALTVSLYVGWSLPKLVWAGATAGVVLIL